MDLYLAASLIALASAWCLMLGARLGRTATPQSLLAIQLAVLSAGIGYFLFAWDRPILTQLIPHAALIVLANWHPVIGSFLAGMYLSADRVGWHRRLLFGPLTLGLAAYAIVAPVIGQPPKCAASDSATALVAQSTPFTCSPAVAASLLRLHGISVTESEMARVCLTRRGTHWLGLYRGLKLKTENTPWDVVAEPFSRDAVRRLDKRPAILSVNIDTREMGPEVEHGFSDNAGHSVLALGPARDGVTVFDPAPSYGIEAWDDSMLASVSGGVILSLVPRDRQDSSSLLAIRVGRVPQQDSVVAGVSYSRVQ